jgi:methyl-accepting chemotaxis protein
MLKLFINLKLKTKFLIGFLTISSLLIIIGISTYISLNQLENQKKEIESCEVLKDGVTDIKFLVAHDLKLLMEIITTPNRTELEEFWKQHEELKKEYTKAYSQVKNTFSNFAWKPEFKYKVIALKKHVKFVNDYREQTLVPSIDQVYALRSEQLKLQGKEGMSLYGLQIKIDALDNKADAKAEIVFKNINDAEKVMQQISDMNDENQKALSNSSKMQNVIMMIVGFALALWIAFFLSNYLVTNVHALKDMIEGLRRGELPNQMTINSKDEIAEMADSINHLTLGLQGTSEFAGEIGKGNFEKDYQPLSDNDVLGNSLINMRSSLIKVAEDEKKRNWATEGLAKFGDILRNNNEGLEVLANNIIAGLVKYLNANQGGLFVVNDANHNDEYLELVACYAWNKKKYIHSRVDKGEGLVGQAWQEQDTLYITDVPKDFVRITSGLGDANPNAFLIVPLTVNDQTYGVVEIASFKQFEQFEVDFVQKLAESIASTLSTAKTNERTKVLLEQSQQQTEEMRAQEEEMRQNMEEMQATQEEMERKEGEMTRMMEQMQQQEEEMRQNMEEMEATQEEMEKQNAIIAESNANTKGILDGVNATMATIEFSPDGFVITANDNFNATMKSQLEDIKGVHHREFLPMEIKNSPDYQTFWSDLSNGKDKKGIFKRVNAKGEIVWLNAIYNPVKNADGEVIKVVKFATDITEQKEIEAQMKAQSDIINSIAIVSKTDLKGNITYVNDEFLKWSKYSKEEVIGKNHRMLKSGEQDDQIFVDMWKTISSGKVFRGEIKNKAKDGTFYWVDAIVAPILDENGKPVEYIAQRFVINEQKEKEESMQMMIEETRAQEEEIRQNLEEVQATSEEMERVMQEMTAQNAIINSVAIVSKTDLKGNITYVNDEFVKWAKYSREEAMGKNHRILRHPDMPAAAFDDLWKTISSGKIWRGEVKNLAKDGSFYWVDAIIAPILDGNGKPKEYIAQRFVINDKKENEAKLNELLNK